MPICVKSEIGPLKRVLLQRPGRELEHLSPNTMGQLLFDDIPYLYGAQREHDCFAQILRDNGAEVVYLEDLTAQVLAGDEELRRRFVEETIRRAGSTAMGYRGDLKRYLLDIQDPLELVLKTMEGVSYQDVFPNEQGRLSSLVHTGARFLMPPIPNLYFTRDPFACIGRGVSLNHMFTDTRNRETLYGDYVLRHHPDYAGQVPLYYTPDQYFWIEGGDILNLSRRVLGVGISQRTQPEAIEQLASAIFADESSEIDTVLAFEIPSTRAFMHLDTVFTQVDVDKFTVHPGILGTLRIFELTGRGQGKLTTREVSGPPGAGAGGLSGSGPGAADPLRRQQPDRRRAGAVERRVQHPVHRPRRGGGVRPELCHQPDPGGQRHPGAENAQRRAVPGPGRPPVHEHAPVAGRDLREYPSIPSIFINRKGEHHYGCEYQRKKLSEAAGLYPGGDPLSAGPVQKFQGYEARRCAPPLAGGEEHRAAV